MGKKKKEKEEKKEDIEKEKSENSEKNDDAEKKVEVLTEEEQKLNEKKEKLKNETVKEGDFVLVDIVGETLEEDRTVVFFATNPKDASRMPNFDPKNSSNYTPELVVVGKGGMLASWLKKVEDSLEGMKFFEEKVIELEPKDAFGERKGDLIEKIPVSRFKKDMNKEPKVGDVYNDKKGRRGTVLRVAQGRMLVDFNHPLAGKKVRYTFKVIDRMDTFDEKVKALIKKNVGFEFADKFEYEYLPDKKLLQIEYPVFLEYYIDNQRNVLMKNTLAHDLYRYIPDIESVRFYQDFKKPAATETEGHVHDHDHDHDHAHDHEHKEEEGKDSDKKEEEQNKEESSDKKDKKEKKSRRRKRKESKK